MSQHDPNLIPEHDNTTLNSNLEDHVTGHWLWTCTFTIFVGWTNSNDQTSVIMKRIQIPTPPPTSSKMFFLWDLYRNLIIVYFWSVVHFHFTAGKSTANTKNDLFIYFFFFYGMTYSICFDLFHPKKKIIISI
jgi:hypothetical protein